MPHLNNYLSKYKRCFHTRIIVYKIKFKLKIII